MSIWGPAKNFDASGNKVFMKLVYEWKVPDFRYYVTEDYWKRDESTGLVFKPALKWDLRDNEFQCQAHIIEKEQFLYLSITLVNLPYPQGGCKFSIINNKNNIFHAISLSFYSGKKSEETCFRDDLEFVQINAIKENLDAILRGNNLIIMCEFNFVMNEAYSRQDLAFPLDLGPFFNSKEFSDVKLVAEGSEIYAHKLILSRKSPVFAKMFAQLSNESQSVVNVENATFEVLREMLRFMYCGWVEDTEEIDKDLLVAAHEYKVNDLKDLCVQNLCNRISADCAVDYLRLGELYHSSVLAKLASDYITELGEIDGGEKKDERCEFLSI